MMGNGTIFVNEGLDYAFSIYTQYKQRPYSPAYNSFLVTVVRQLMNIYGEAEILNSYLTGSVSLFNQCLKKYGISQEDVEVFLARIHNYYLWAKEAEKKLVKPKSVDFVVIQETLIDMMIKKMNTTQIEALEIKSFEDLLYTPDNPSSSYVAFNMLAAYDKNAIKYYWKSALYKLENAINFVQVKENILDELAYKAIGFDVLEVESMPQRTIDEINEQVFNHYKINDVNLSLAEKLIKLKEALTRPAPPTGIADPLSSGSGYVDGLLLLATVVTIAMISFILTIFLAR